MPADFAYMTSAKNLKPIMERIQGAGTPPKFTHDFLKSLGFTSSTDRPIITVLKNLGFLTADGVPTERYNAYRDTSRSGQALAEGLRDGWSAVFLADQKAHERSTTQLTELFKSVSGKGEAVARKMATTFKALSDMGDWTVVPAHTTATAAPLPPEPEVEESPSEPHQRTRVALHHDVHVHLPATSDVSVYTAIFRALRAELLD